jgi:hypothetical protein
MTHEGQLCPLDASPLVFLSGSYGEKDIDLSVCYCPRCDVAVIFQAPTRSPKPPAILQWHRRQGQLELREEDRKRWVELPRQFRDCWESNIRHNVGQFLAGRHSEGVGCPMDGTRIPVLYRWLDASGKRWLLSWCKWCQMGFVFASDADYGWEFCAGVVWHKGQQMYEFVKEYATAAKHAVSPQLVTELPPLPTLSPAAEPRAPADGGGM